MHRDRISASGAHASSDLCSADVAEPAVSKPRTAALSCVGAFAGAGGIESGFARAGIQASSLIENWASARAVLERRFPEATLHSDIRDVARLPHADVFSGGFPCTDLSQAGFTAGIDGASSSLVHELFRLLPVVRPSWFVVENVRNMLNLHRGRAMSVLVQELERMGYAWAYRVVDSRAFGVPQRRQRVLLVASRQDDPRGVLFCDDVGDRRASTYRSDAFGFYWTEGNRGLGWARDAVPTLKGSSTLGIPSPPGVWVPDAEIGRRIIKPRIEDGESMQGFRRGWTAPADAASRRRGDRWKLVGNAVTVPASAWLGTRLVGPGTFDTTLVKPLVKGERWPLAACGSRGRHHAVDVTPFPVRRPYRHLSDVLDLDLCDPLSLKATAGFLFRVQRSTLTVDQDFLLDLKTHVAALGGD